MCGCEKRKGIWRTKDGKKICRVCARKMKREEN